MRAKGGHCSHWLSLQLPRNANHDGSSYVFCTWEKEKWGRRTIQIFSISSSAGRGQGDRGQTGEGGEVDLRGVEGGEGNRVGWMEGDEGSHFVGDECGKNTTGWIGETGEGEACFVGEEDWEGARWAG